MNRDEIIAMVQEAIFDHPNDNPFDFRLSNIEAIERFAALVAAAEREACAKLCDELRDEDGNVSFCIAGAVMTREDIIQLALEHFGAVLKPSDFFEPYGTECAAAIRARGER